MTCDRCKKEIDQLSSNWGNCTECGDNLCESCSGGFDAKGTCEKCLLKLQFDKARELAESFREQAVANLLWPMQGDEALTKLLATFIITQIYEKTADKSILR
jgi:predicted amidophosphoribosyltransferase